MMVKYTDIQKSLVSKLKSKLPNIDIESNDISEGFNRPSFFIKFDNISNADFMDVSMDRKLTVRIYYFPSNRHVNEIENLDMMDELNDIFLVNNIVKINDECTIEIEEVNVSEVDKVVRCYFDLEFNEDYNREDDTPLMEEIEIK